VQQQFARPAFHQPGKCWLYAPAALKRDQIEPLSKTLQASCRLWKKGGYLYCQADSMPHPLVLPVLMSDGCGYPALSTVLRAWSEMGSTRWDAFRNYMATAANRQADSQIQRTDEIGQFVCDDIEVLHERLDTRFNTDVANCVKDWVFVMRCL